MKLKGNVKSGLGNAHIWVKKIEDIFIEKEQIKLFPGTLNVELNREYKLNTYWIIKPEEYGGTQNVYAQECTLKGHKCFILRSEKTIHKHNIIEVVSDVNFRKTYNLKDGDTVEIVL